ncbi:MAG: 3-hydroxyacyl-CoA dehydrogenase NAD-binding protein [Thermoleophilia bacterium]|nr:3-hydroxyacyl-CoA dehydrogenase NAD-binding protein [Thermoleophilia bacterium]
MSATAPASEPLTGHPDVSNVPPVARVAVIGFGTMGSGIAQVCAQAGLSVHVVEPSEAVIERDMAGITRQLDKAVAKGKLEQADRDATLTRIDPSTDLSHAFDAELVIEAIPERLDLKLDLFRTLDESMSADAVLATNTSALSVTEIAAATSRPNRVCGLHWFNPAPVLPLVEVVRAERTDDATLARAYAFVQQVGKHPVVCRDTPGFIVNRILLPILSDVVGLWDQGLASAQDIDDACRMGLNWPIGPLALCDLVGLDVAVHASEALYESTREPKHAPAPAMVRMAKAGKLGRKSGEGFYTY